MYQLDPTHAIVKPTGARWLVLLFACTLSLITYLDRICIMRSRSDIQHDLGFNDRQMGWVFSAFLIGYALFEVPGGWMGDRWGSRRVLTRIVVCWSFFTALTGWVYSSPDDTGLSLILFGEVLSQGLILMLLVRFLFGLGEAGAYPNLTRVVRDWYPVQERAVAQGAIWMSARLGGAIAPFVIGRLTVVVGWRHAFLILGAIGVVWAILFWWWFRDRPEEHPDCNEAERALIHERPATRPLIAASEGHAWPGIAALAGSTTMWAMCFASFWVCFGWYFYPTWQPKYLEEVFAFKPDDYRAEILTGLPFFCGALGSLVGGRLSDRLVVSTGSRRWGRSLVGLFGFTGAGLCVLATGFVTSAWQAVTLLCLAFLINDLAIPVIWASCADVGGRFAGSVSGLMNTVGAVGAIISPILIPQVKDWVPQHYSLAQQWQIIFVGMAGAWFLAAAAWLFIDASRKIAGASPDPHSPPGGSQ
jgi:MFS family permease